MFDFNAETGLVRIYGIIGEDVSASMFLTALEAMDGRDIKIRIQSEGGDIITGLSMLNTLQAYPGSVAVEVDSLAASMATVLMMGADEISANENAIVMIHRAWAYAVGNAEDLRLHADVLEKLDWNIAGIYAARAGGDSARWFERMREEKHYTAAEALEVGLLDRVIEAAGSKPSNRVEPLSRIANVAMARAFVTRLEADPEPETPRPHLARQKTLLQSLSLKLKRKN